MLLFTASAAADNFGQAISICSKHGNSPSEREGAFEDLGWQRPIDFAFMIPIVTDGLAVQNPPEENTTIAWVDRRTWAETLATGIIKTAMPVVFFTGNTITLMDQQAGSGFPTCLVYSEYDRNTEELLDNLNEAGGLLDWDYSFRGEMSAIVADSNNRDWRTDVVIYGTRTDQLPQLQPPLSTSLAATLITKPVRKPND